MWRIREAIVAATDRRERSPMNIRGDCRGNRLCVYSLQATGDGLVTCRSLVLNMFNSSNQCGDCRLVSSHQATGCATTIACSLATIASCNRHINALFRDIDTLLYYIKPVMLSRTLCSRTRPRLRPREPKTRTRTRTLLFVFEAPRGRG